MVEEKLWQTCVCFHGHACPGLTIGYRAAVLAIDKLDLQFSPDEELVAICENDACGVDAIQVILGCSAGKGNLLFHLTGKQAFSFYRRDTGTSFRCLLKPSPKEMSREQAFDWYQNQPTDDLFITMPVRIQLPVHARFFNSIACTKCGEMAAEHFLRMEDNQLVCLDCWDSYDRFNI